MMNPPTVFSGVCLQLFQKLKNVRGNSLLICFIVFLCNTRIASATGSAALVSSTDLFTNRSGCLYAGRRYKNGAEVATAEKCLRCLCLSSNLVCRLRVCSQVPDPPPAGCILLQRANDCCRQLVCHQDGAASENSILEGRSRNGNPVLSQNGAGCLHNGTVYGEGSAMSTSSLCEYCYCIKGLQHCVKPQCVLAMPGCQPVFTKHSCCPIKYNCSHAVSTTTSLPILQRNKGCLVNGTRYQEGEMLDGLAKKCETCYCVQGVPRCEPVTCSVPSGVKKHCTPVYSDLHCCPTSYKCSQQSYEEMPKETRNFSSNEDKTVDSASERKSHTTETEIKLQAAETELFPTTSKHSTRPKSNYSETSKSPQKNNSETSRNPQSSKTNNSETAKSPQSQKNNSETSRNPQSPKANNSETLKNHQLVSNSALPTETTDLTTSEGRTETIYVTTTELTTDDLTTEDLTTLVYDVDYSSTMDSSEISTTDVDSTTLDTMTTSEPFLPTVLPSSTVRADVNETVESLKSNDSSSTTTVKSIPPELEAILNSTQNKEQSEDYDYDYNESSLPPSLPNLRIIPFVAADAVVAKTDTGNGATYPGKPLLPTQQRNKPPYYKVNHHNRFSPPTETEGGFVPKEPPTLDHPPYDSKVEFPYHSVGFNIEITVPPTADQALPASSANLDKMCIHNGKRYSYGDVVGEPLSCKLCVCYNYGEIVCQEPKCSPPQAGCTRVHDPTVGCCGRIVCGTNDLDSPTRVIDTPPPAQQHPHFPPATTNLPAFTIADPVVSTPDPFRDVIRTEPAPDLPSLIGQIIHLWDQPTTQQYGPTSSSLPSITTGASEQDEDGNRNGSGTGNGYGTGNVNGIGNGNGTGDVNEIGNKNGSGTGNETGNRNGSGTGNRNEFGNGNGTGHRNGIGNGNGTGNEITGSGVEKENGNRNWSSGNEMVDEVGKTGNGSNGIGDGSNGIGNIINGIGTGGNGIGNGSNGMGNGSNGIGTYEMRNGSNGLENGVNNGIVDHSNKGYVYNGNKNSNIDYSIINLEGGNNQGNDKKNISSENINSDRDSIYKESDFKVENNEEKIDNNNLHNQQNAQIDRINVGFTSSEEEIYQTPIFKSNKTKTDLPAVFDEVEEDTSDSSPENVDPHLARFPSKVEPDSVFLPSVPSKVVVQNIDSKPPILSEIPRVEVVSKIETHVTSTESQVVSSTKNTLKSSTKINMQQSITNKFDLGTVTKSPTNNKTSISSSTTPRNIETTSKISDLSSFLFSTDESDVVNDHNDHDDDEDDSDPELKNEESDYSDNFSLDSVFKFFFDSGSEASEASTVKVQATETVTPPTSSTSTSRKPVSLKTPIFPVTTVKPSVTNKTSSLKFPTTTYSPVRVSPLKNTYFSSRITAKPVKDIINNSPKNVSTINKTDATNHSKIDSNVDESKQEVRLSPDDFDKMIENEKLRTEKPIIYINRFHSVTSDHKTHNRTRIPGTIPRIPPSGIGNRNNVTGYKNNVTGAVTSTGSKFEKGSLNGTINKFVTGANSSNKVDSVRGSNNGTVNKFGNFGTVTPGSHKPDGVRGSNNGTVNKFSNFVAGNKIDGVRGTSNGTFNKFSGYAAINRTPGNRNTTGGIIKPLNRIPGVYNRVPGTVSRISSTTAKSSPLTDDDEVQHISAVQPTTADPSAVTGLLKLAGCNIYGRMYRVGKIIAELSGPCLECMCTEVGVQCRPLPC